MVQRLGGGAGLLKSFVNRVDLLPKLGGDLLFGIQRLASLGCDAPVVDGLLVLALKSLLHGPSVNIPEVDSCSHQIVCLCSCSSRITQAIGHLLDQGDYLEGYLLNDLANEIMFNGSDQMNRQIAADLAAVDSRLTRRYSPGEGEMDLPYQGLLLQCFREDHRLDFVKLTDSFMLTPEKSMLYLYGADQRNPGVSVEHDCSICPNKTCFFRAEK